MWLQVKEPQNLHLTLGKCWCITTELAGTHSPVQGHFSRMDSRPGDVELRFSSWCMVSQFTRPASSHLKSLTRHVNLIAFRKSIFFKKRDAAAARHPGDLSQCTLRVSSPSSDSVTFQIKAGGEASATERKLSSRTCNVMKSPPKKKKKKI